MKEVEAKAKETIVEQLNILDEMDTSTPEYEKVATSTAKLMSEYTAMQRVEAEQKSAKHDRIIKAGEVVGKYALIATLAYASFLFEGKEGGIFSSTIGRTIFKNVIPRA